MITTIPNESEIKTIQHIALLSAKSNLCAKLGGEANIFLILMAAREYGIPPVMALSGGIMVINGVVQLSARTMNMMIRRSGHKIINIETTDKICKLKGIRSDTQEEEEACFTIDDADRAGLLRNPSWAKYPKDMLYARCLSGLARRLFSDVIANSYVEGEIEEEKPIAVTPISVPEEKNPNVRQREDILKSVISLLEGEDELMGRIEAKNGPIQEIPTHMLETIENYLIERRKVSCTQ